MQPHSIDEHPNENRFRLRLTNLIDDVQLSILDSFDLPELIAIAETSKEYSVFVADTFKRKYLKNKTLVIANPFYPEGGTTINSSFDDTYVQISIDKIIIDHFDADLKILRLFNSVITKLTIQFNTNSMDVLPAVRKIMTYIDTYCTDTLTEMNIVNYADNFFFEKISKQFRRVENVSIIGRFKSLNSATLAFEEMFPALRKLTMLKFIEIENKTSVVNQNFPNLTELIVRITSDEKSFMQNHIQTMLRNNRQIQSLSISCVSRSLLKFVNECLPNVSELSIEHYYNDLDDMSQIVFNNVTHFKVISWDKTSGPANIQFPNLMEFGANACARSSDKWIDLVNDTIQNTKSFQRLKVWQEGDAIDFLSNEQLEKLAKFEMDLDEVHLKLSENVTDESIAKFVGMNEKTKKILLSRNNPPNSFGGVTHMIRTKFPRKWNIIDLNDELLLKRRIL